MKVGQREIETQKRVLKFFEEKLGYTTFYGRDRGEKGNMSSTYKNIDDYLLNNCICSIGIDRSKSEIST